jgi:AcrR family transcriptional regulator
MAATARAPKPKARRDREATRKSIVEAAKQVLVAEGFGGLGVNAVARKAGCDKQLVYRYFGGIDGVVEAIGSDLADWVRVSLEPLEQLPPARSYAELMSRLAVGFLEALKKDVLVQKLIAWEISEPSPHVAQLTEVRSHALMIWMAGQRRDLSPPPGVDAQMMNALLIAAVQHIVLAGSASGMFAGVRLSQSSDWARVQDALQELVATMFAGFDPTDAEGG